MELESNKRVRVKQFIICDHVHWSIIYLSLSRYLIWVYFVYKDLEVMLYDLALNVRNRSNINRIYIRSAHRNNSFSGSPFQQCYSIHRGPDLIHWLILNCQWTSLMRNILRSKERVVCTRCHCEIPSLISNFLTLRRVIQCYSQKALKSTAPSSWKHRSKSAYF